MSTSSVLESDRSHTLLIRDQVSDRRKDSFLTILRQSNTPQNRPAEST